MPGVTMTGNTNTVCAQDVLDTAVGEWVLVPSGELGALSALHWPPTLQILVPPFTCIPRPSSK